MTNSYGENSQSILIVDDDSLSRNLISDAIKAEGFELLTEAENGLKALDYVQTTNFDLVISDLNMPGMNGIELLHKIKDINPATAVIIMTGYPSIDVSVSAMQYGAVDFLTKPFKIDNLIFKVKLYLKEKKLLTAKELDTKTESFRLTEKIRELSLVSSIYDSIDKAGSSNDDIFKDIVELSINVSSGESCMITLFDEKTDVFLPKMIKNRNGNEIASSDVISPYLESVFKEVTKSGEAVIRNPFDDNNPFNSVLCVPLMIRNKVFGLLSLINQESNNIFTPKDMDYISSLTSRASLNLENRILYESIFSSILDTLKSLVRSIQARDDYTERHSVNVTNLSVKTAETMKLSPDEIECLKIAASLHDIGKTATPDSILLKPERLTDEEYDIIKTHPEVGENILESIKLFETEREIIRHHHESWDGSGYPDGIKGNDIPLLSRIISVADAYDAMTSDRPYRKGMTVADAVGELKRNRNIQFDKEIVDAFLVTIKQ